jgi:hypothetical protein
MTQMIAHYENVIVLLILPLFGVVFFVVSNEFKLEKYIVPQKLYKDFILLSNIWFIINTINITI